MLLVARSIDWRAHDLLQAGAHLRVHSVFERALNLVDRDEAIVGLVGPSGGNGPALVVLEDLPPGGFPLQRLRPGLPVEVALERRLQVARWLLVDLAPARLWQRPSPRHPPQPDQTRARVRQAADLAFRLGGADGLGGLLPHLDALLAGSESPPGDLPPLLRAAWLGLAELLPAWRSEQVAAVRQAARRLAGLGPGQTPSGDDLLAGFVVAWGRAGGPTPCPLPKGEGVGSPSPRGKGSWGVRSRRPTAQARACLEAARGRTTDLGLARLRYAVEGDLDERSERALAALLGGDEPEVEATTRELLGYGHSSGLDTLVGLLLGLTLAPGPASQLRGDQHG